MVLEIRSGACVCTLGVGVTDRPGACVIAGSVLQIVSAPGQSYLRPPGPMVMQTVSQAGALSALGSKPPTSGPGPTPVAPPGRVL